jgi:hypothetical protein
MRNFVKNLLKMDAYIIESTVENGQVTIDLPTNLHNKNVKITIDEIVNTTPPKEPLKRSLPELEEVEGIIPARKKIDLTQLFGAFNDKSAGLNEQDEDDSDFWQPRKRTDITKLRGALKLNMTIDEVDSLTKSWRDEWERDFS